MGQGRTEAPARALRRRRRGACADGRPERIDPDARAGDDASDVGGHVRQGDRLQRPHLLLAGPACTMHHAPCTMRHAPCAMQQQPPASASRRARPGCGARADRARGQAAIDAGTMASYGLNKRAVAVRRCRGIGKKDMKLNDVTPAIKVRPALPPPPSPNPAPSTSLRARCPAPGRLGAADQPTPQDQPTSQISQRPGSLKASPARGGRSTPRRTWSRRTTWSWRASPQRCCRSRSATSSSERAAAASVYGGAPVFGPPGWGARRPLRPFMEARPFSAPLWGMEAVSSCARESP